MQTDYSSVVKEKVRLVADVFNRVNYQQTPEFRRNIEELSDLIINAPVNNPDGEYLDVNCGVNFKSLTGREVLKTSLDHYVLSSKNEPPRADSGLPEWYHGICVAINLRSAGLDLVSVLGGIFHDLVENKVEKKVDELKEQYPDKRLSHKYQTLCSFYAGKFARRLSDRLIRTSVDEQQAEYVVDSLIYINGKMIRTLFDKNYFKDVKRLFDSDYDPFNVLLGYEGKKQERFKLLNSYRAAAIKFADRIDNTASLTTLTDIKRMKNIYKNLCLQQEFRFEHAKQDNFLIAPFINRVLTLDQMLAFISYKESKVLLENVRRLVDPRTFSALVRRSISLDKEGWYDTFTEDGPSKNIYESLIAGKFGIKDAFEQDPKLFVWSAIVLTHLARKFKQDKHFKMGGYDHAGPTFPDIHTQTKPIKIAI